jgi:uncharacterized protein (UPF0332 family)
MNKEQKALINKAKDSLKASILLAENKLYNFAGARAYYTMFYIAEAFLWSKGLTFSSHSAVISAFGKEFTKTGILPSEFHRYLINAQDKRTQGDYDIDEENNLTEIDVNNIITQSKLFIKLAEENL